MNRFLTPLRRKWKVVGPSLRSTRKRLGLSLEEVASRSGHTVEEVQAFEEDLYLLRVGDILRLKRALAGETLLGIEDGVVIRWDPDRVRRRMKRLERLGAYDYKISAQEAAREARSMKREFQALELRTQGLKFDQVGERLGVGGQQARNLAGRCLLRWFGIAKHLWGRLKPCTCQACCAGALALYKANERSRERFEAAHPEIAEMRSIQEERRAS